MATQRVAVGKHLAERHAERGSDCFSTPAAGTDDALAASAGIKAGITGYSGQSFVLPQKLLLDGSSIPLLGGRHDCSLFSGPSAKGRVGVGVGVKTLLQRIFADIGELDKQHSLNFARQSSRSSLNHASSAVFHRLQCVSVVRC